MRTLVTTVLLISLGISPALSQSTREGDMLRVASWNIGEIEAGSGENARIMAEHLKILKIDILALNHIDGNAERRNQQLDAIFGKTNERARYDWDYVLFPNRNISDRSGLVGVAWDRNRVTLETGPFHESLDEENSLWQRPPNAVKFSAGSGLTDIVLMPVQLDPKNVAAECLAGTRGQEASDLVNHIESAAIHFGDDDIVVIGDTDCVRDDPGQRQRFSTERYLEFETGSLSQYVTGRAGYEQVMVPTNEPEFERTSFYTIQEAESQKAERPFSDHFLLLGPIEVQVDDD